MSLAGGDVFAGYTVVRQLGSGGMGEVYLVKHPRLPRLDALKVLPVEISTNREFRSRFEREVDLLATMRHPHIVGVHDRGDDDGHLWITMDFVEGYDAALLLREQWPDGMPVDEVVTIVSAVADALDYAQERQLLHRDVKPAKILLTDDVGPKRRARLTGFGIARHTNDGAGLTAANMTVADVNYAAPEQLLDEDVDGRADQYALAATTYHLLTGSAPFPHTNPTVVISRHLNTQPPALANTHPQLAALDPVLGRALAKNREARYPTAREYANALTDALRDTGTSGNAWSSPPRTSGAGFFTPGPAPTSPVDTPTTYTAAPAAEAPPVYVSDWGETQHNAKKEHRAVEPRAATPSHPTPPTPSRGGPPPVLIGVAIGTAVVLIALVTYVVLKAAAGDSSKSAPQVTPTPPMSISSATLASSTNPSRPTTRAAPTTTVQQIDCGIDLGSPVVTSAVVEVEPGAAYPLDRANAWGNFDPCAPLSVALVPTAMGTGSSPVEPLMFQMGRFIGKATPNGIGYLRFNEQLTTDDTVVLTFRTSIGTCGGCSDGTYADVRFQARNGRVVALDPIPN